MRPHNEFLACHERLRKQFKQITDERPNVRGIEWVELERVELAVAANQWAEAHGLPTRVTRDDIERFETTALGHVDYASKLCLYVAELLYPHPRQG